MLPLFHRHDVRAVDYAMRTVAPDQEVFVSYKPIKFPWDVRAVKSVMPTMVVGIFPKDQSPRREGEEWASYLKRIASVWTYEPISQQFGGRYLYDED